MVTRNKLIYKQQIYNNNSSNWSHFSDFKKLSLFLPQLIYENFCSVNYINKCLNNLMKFWEQNVTFYAMKQC